MEICKKKRNNKSANVNTYENVKVIVRCRPISEKELGLTNFSVVDVFPSECVIEIFNPKDNGKDNKKMYTYDAVYGWNASQQILYDETVKPLVCSVLEGFNGCVFAYGQTGAGKTYTMEGNIEIPEREGIIPKVFNQIWAHINQTKNFKFLVSIRYLEIYMEEIRDLLKTKSTKLLELREVEGKGVYIPNLFTFNCKSVKDMHRAMKIGNKNRTVSCTNMNTHSSRSHAIFQISIEMCDHETNKVHVGKLNLIDLAGSERQSKTGTTDDRLKEACKINLALSSLGKVISALSENSVHIPYRDSKLTRLLQDSLGGNSKTIMIANIGPASSNYEETLTTLRYANRAKNISNKPVMNEDPEDAKLREYLAEILALKKLIAERQQEKIETCVTVEDESEESDSNSEEFSIDVEINKEQKVELVKSLESEKLTVEELASKLKILEKQLIEGGQDEVNKQQLQIQQKIYEVVHKEQEEQNIQKKLELEAEENLDLQKTYDSIQQELVHKTRILQKFFNRWQALKKQINYIKKEHVEEMQKLEGTQEEILKEQRIQQLQAVNFIEFKAQSKLLNKTKYNEKTDSWEIVNRKLTKRELASFRRPPNRYQISEYKKNKYEKSNTIRSKNQNVLDLKLYEPANSTYVYKNPKIPPKYRKVVEACFKYEIDNNNYIEVLEPPKSFQAKELMKRPKKTKIEVMNFPEDVKEIHQQFLYKDYAKRSSSRMSFRSASSRKKYIN